VTAPIVIGKLDRGARGVLTTTLHNDAVPYIAFRHVERDGREGGRLVVKLEEIETIAALLTKAKAVAGGSKAQHRTVRATQEELELERKLF
jgi:hypothetical protein